LKEEKLESTNFHLLLTDGKSEAKPTQELLKQWQNNGGNNMKLFIIRGLPASGKSTLAKRATDDTRDL